MQIRQTRLRSPEVVEDTEKPTDRQERITGWRQDRIARGRVLILGAGALGNEAVKNLALMGLGYMFIADMDHVSVSNLSRAVFFRKRDALQQRNKAELLAKRAHQLNVTPDSFIQTFQQDLVWQLGGGVFRRVDAVLGCLDNVEARMSANATCLLTGTPFLDGGILGLTGNLTAIHAPFTACWECTTTQKERINAKSRYDSCTNVMRRDIESGRLPTVQVASSIIAGFQTQEVVKVIQQQPWAAGNIIQYNATSARLDVDVLQIARRPDCWCNTAHVLEHILELPLSAHKHTLLQFIQALEAQGFTHPYAIFPDQVVVNRLCLQCQWQDPLLRPSFSLDTSVLRCSHCGAEGYEWIKLQSVGDSNEQSFLQEGLSSAFYQKMLRCSLAELGFPPLALIPFFHDANSGALDQLPVAELTADAVDVMGSAQYASVAVRHNNA